MRVCVCVCVCVCVVERITHVSVACAAHMCLRGAQLCVYGRGVHVEMHRFTEPLEYNLRAIKHACQARMHACQHERPSQDPRRHILFTPFIADAPVRLLA